LRRAQLTGGFRANRVLLISYLALASIPEFGLLPSTKLKNPLRLQSTFERAYVQNNWSSCEILRLIVEQNLNFEVSETTVVLID